MAEKFLTQEQLSVFCSSLAMLLRSGASLSEVSSLFEEDGMDTALRQASTEISLSVAAGETFSAAAEKTGVFPEYALSVFSTAELSGRLDEALDRLADHYDRQSALYDRLRSTLTYPAVLMLMMCGVLAVLVFAVLPMFERVYDNLTGSLLSSSYAYVLAATLIGRISLRGFWASFCSFWRLVCAPIKVGKSSEIQWKRAASRAKPRGFWRSPR